MASLDVQFVSLARMTDMAPETTPCQEQYRVRQQSRHSIHARMSVEHALVVVVGSVCGRNSGSVSVEAAGGAGVSGVVYVR